MIRPGFIGSGSVVNWVMDQINHKGPFGFSINQQGPKFQLSESLGSEIVTFPKLS